MACPLASERVWTDKTNYSAAEKQYYESLSKLLKEGNPGNVETSSSSDDFLKKDESLQKSPMKSVKNSKKHKKEPKFQDDDSILVQPVDVMHRHAVMQPNPQQQPAAAQKKEKKEKKNKQNKNVDAELGAKCGSTAPAKVEKEKRISESSMKSEQSFIEISSKKKSKKEKKEKKALLSNRDDTSISSIETATVHQMKSGADEVFVTEHNRKAENKSKDVKEKKNKADKKKLNKDAVGSSSIENMGDSNDVAHGQDDEKANGGAGQSSSLASEIAKARQHIKNSLERMDGIAALASTPSAELLDRLQSVEKINSQLKSNVDNLQKMVVSLQDRIKSLELGLGGKSAAAPSASGSSASQVTQTKPAAKEDDDDGVDLFGSDSEEEDEAAAKVREERLAAYNAKKSKKPILIAKSNIILDIKPWDDETDMKKMEVEVRKIVADGLLWGAAKLVPLAYGIHKLQISCVVEDDKVSIDWLQEELQNIEDLIQSVDIAAFNKI